MRASHGYGKRIKGLSVGQEVPRGQPSAMEGGSATMETRAYLLDITGLPEEEALLRVDTLRREKAERISPQCQRAASLGAGLLLQRAVQDFRSGEGTAKNSGCSTVVLSVAQLLEGAAEPEELSYCYGRGGKPYLKSLPLYFSLSHSGRMVLCAVSSREIGADIQKIVQGEEMRTANRFFSDTERELLNGCEDEGERRRLFFALWVRKEAYGKLTGQGIYKTVTENVMNREELSWYFPNPPEGYAAAVCTRKLELQG